MSFSWDARWASRKVTVRCELLLLSPELKLGHLPSHRQTGHKKKLNTYIGFSELLDMEPFMEQKSK